MATGNTAPQENVGANIICHMTESFLGKDMTEQVELLTSGVPDQMSKVTERMNLAYMDEGIQQCEGQLTEHSKVHFIFVLVEKVVFNLYYNLKIMPTNVDKVIKHVVEKVMDEVQDIDLCFRCKSFKIYKKINIKLIKRFGSPEAVLFLLNIKDPVIEQCIITLLKQKMMKPTNNQNVIQRFFSTFQKKSSVWRAQNVGVLQVPQKWKHKKCNI